MKTLFSFLFAFTFLLTGCDSINSKSDEFKLDIDNKSNHYFQLFAKKSNDPLSAYLSTTAFKTLDPKVRARTFIDEITPNFSKDAVTFNTSYDLVLVFANDTRTSVEKFEVAEKYKKTITLKKGESLTWTITD